MTLDAGELAQVRARAQRAMHEDADPADALAREQLLQWYRESVKVSGHFDASRQRKPDDPHAIDELDAIEWIAALARAGHQPAAALLERGISDRCVRGLLALAPARVIQAATLLPPFARALLKYAAQRKSRVPLPRLLEWLDVAGRLHRQSAVALRALIEVAGEPEAEDVRAIITQSCFAFDVKSVPNFASLQLMELAFRYLKSDVASGRALGVALLGRAAELHPSRGKILRLIRDMSAIAGDYMRDWLRQYPDFMDPKARMHGGVAFERGEATGTPDLVNALRWYETCVKLPPWQDEAQQRFNPDFALAVSYEIPYPRNEWRQKIVKDWLERGAQAGDARCADALKHMAAAP